MVSFLLLLLYEQDKLQKEPDGLCVTTLFEVFLFLVKRATFLYYFTVVAGLLIRPLHHLVVDKLMEMRVFYTKELL